MKANVRILDKTFRPYLSHEEILKAIDSIALKLNKDYGNETVPPVILCTMNGAMQFTTHLLERLDFDLQLSCIKLSSYCDTHSTGDVTVAMDTTADLKGRRVIVTEDVVDTGLTIRKMKEILKEKEVADVRVCTMMYKPSSFHNQLVKDGILTSGSSSEDMKAFEPEYCCFSIPDDFIIGFGLDYNEIGRNYSDIYVLDK